jgi:hypothetical protein
MINQMTLDKPVELSDEQLNGVVGMKGSGKPAPIELSQSEMIVNKINKYYEGGGSERDRERDERLNGCHDMTIYDY